MRVPGISSRRGTGLGAAEPIVGLPVQVAVSLQDDSPGRFAPRSALDALAERLYLRGRRFLVLRRGTDPREQQLGGSFSIAVDLPALAQKTGRFRHLHEVSGALPFFREAWSEFAHDCRLERMVTIVLDRRTGGLRRVLRIGGPPHVVGGQIVHSVTPCIQPSEGGENRLDVHETALGTVHTHPFGIAPSLMDNELVRQLEGMESLSGAPGPALDERLELQGRCGNELYTLLRDGRGFVNVILMGADAGANKELGPILGDLSGCPL
jgi:hypothetical protein